MKIRILSANERPSEGKPPFPTLRLSDLSDVLALESRSRWNHPSNQVSSGLGRVVYPRSAFVRVDVRVFTQSLKPGEN